VNEAFAWFTIGGLVGLAVGVLVTAAACAASVTCREDQ
jgi:hypothetical protein